VHNFKKLKFFSLPIFVDVVEPEVADEDVHPKCIFSICVCPAGFIFDGKRICQKDVQAAGDV
jgi:hypothetical protein